MREYIPPAGGRSSGGARRLSPKPRPALVGGDDGVHDVRRRLEVETPANDKRVGLEGHIQRLDILQRSLLPRPAPIRLKFSVICYFYKTLIGFRLLSWKNS